MSMLALDVHDHPYPYPFGWVNKDGYIRATTHCKIRSTISENYIDEVEVDVVLRSIWNPLHVHEGCDIYEVRKPIPPVKDGNHSSSMCTKEIQDLFGKW